MALAIMAMAMAMAMGMDERGKMNFEVGKYYKRRDGKKVRCIATDNGGRYCVVMMSDNNVSLVAHDGRFYDNQVKGGSTQDIVAEWKEPVKVSGWINIYQGNLHSGLYSAKILADSMRDPDRIACVYVEGTEGVDPNSEGE